MYSMKWMKGERKWNNFLLTSLHISFFLNKVERRGHPYTRRKNVDDKAVREENYIRYFSISFSVCSAVLLWVLCSFVLCLLCFGKIPFGRRLLCWKLVEMSEGENEGRSAGKVVRECCKTLNYCSDFCFCRLRSVTVAVKKTWKK